MGMTRRMSKTSEIRRAAAATKAAKAPKVKVKGEGGGFLGALVLFAAVVLLAGGGVLALFQVDWAGPREAWVAGGGVAGALGIAALVYYFDKWGKL